MWVDPKIVASVVFVRSAFKNNSSMNKKKIHIYATRFNEKISKHLKD